MGLNNNWVKNGPNMHVVTHELSKTPECCYWLRVVNDSVGSKEHVAA